MQGEIASSRLYIGCVNGHVQGFSLSAMSTGASKGDKLRVLRLWNFYTERPVFSSMSEIVLVDYYLLLIPFHFLSFNSFLFTNDLNLFYFTLVDNIYL